MSHDERAAASMEQFRQSVAVRQDLLSVLIGLSRVVRNSASGSSCTTRSAEAGPSTTRRRQT
jgi:hypothetical protein